MRDTIYRDDAIGAVAEDLASVLNVSKDETRELAEHALSALPSAGPQTGELISREEPTVIRSRTFMPTKDFKEWAERIRDVNPNAVVIPCDAEVVSAEAEEHRIYKDVYNTGKAHASADAVHGWIPCSERLPDVGELVLITQNRGDGDKTVETAYLTSDGPNDLYWNIELFKSRETDEVLAWMPLPKPYEPKTKRRG